MHTLISTTSSSASGPLVGHAYMCQADEPMPALGVGEVRRHDGRWARAREAVQDAISAALSGERTLCGLRCSQVVTRCAGRPLAMQAAHEIEQALKFKMIERHLFACDKRRHLHRELEALARYLRQSV